MSRRGSSKKPVVRSQYRRPKGRLRVWMTINVLVLGALMFAVGKMAVTSSAAAASKEAAAVASAYPTPTAVPSGATPAATEPVASADSSRIPTVQQFLNPTGKYYGLSAPDFPWSQSTVDKYTLLDGGVAPNMAEYFLNWTQNFQPATVMDAYSHAELPVLSWEPWAGGSSILYKAVGQLAYSLESIIDGSHDAYITQFAEAIKANKWPIAIRFAHEMNGSWYPWSESVNGNKPGQYVEAWRHVHDIFTKVGATNVIWIWSPNVIRGMTNVSLSELYPGDAYVDWVGATAYEVTESTAEQVMGPTMAEIRKFTQKPMLITETGAEPNPEKTAFTASLLAWIPTQPDILGFVWFEYNGTDGGRTNWTFEGDPGTLQAFKTGIAAYPLARIPVPPS